MFCKESLGKIKWRAFRKHFGPSLESLITMEQQCTVLSVRKKKEESYLAKLRWSDVVNFHCMQMSLVMRTRFIFGND